MNITYKFVKIQFPSSSKKYQYFCPFNLIKIGDIVKVEGSKSNGRVTDVIIIPREKLQSEITKYKRVMFIVQTKQINYASQGLDCSITVNKKDYKINDINVKSNDSKPLINNNNNMNNKIKKEEDGKKTDDTKKRPIHTYEEIKILYKLGITDEQSLYESSSKNENNLDNSMSVNEIKSIFDSTVNNTHESSNLNNPNSKKKDFDNIDFNKIFNE